jgi:hypothetical protein
MYSTIGRRYFLLEDYLSNTGQNYFVQVLCFKYRTKLLCTSTMLQVLDKITVYKYYASSTGQNYFVQVLCFKYGTKLLCTSTLCFKYWTKLLCTSTMLKVLDKITLYKYFAAPESPTASVLTLFMFFKGPTLLLYKFEQSLHVKQLGFG